MTYLMGSSSMPPVASPDIFSDANTGDPGYDVIERAGMATGFDRSGLGLAKNYLSLPPLAGGLENYSDTNEFRDNAVDQGIPTIHQRFTPSPEIADRWGTLLEEDPKLFSARYPDIPWEPGMTEARAQAIQEHLDTQKVRDYYMSRNKTAAFVGQFIGGAASPENYIPVFGELGKGYELGRAADIAIGAARSAADAAVVTGGLDVASSPLRSKMGEDTSWTAMAQDIGYGALAGATFGGVLHSLGHAVDIATAESKAAVTVSPEAKARSNIIMNDAIHSYITSTDGEIHLSPQSGEMMGEQFRTVDANDVKVDWNNLVKTDDGRVHIDNLAQRFMDDLAVKTMMEDTYATKDNQPGSPIETLYHGTSRILEGRLKGNDNVGGLLWLSNSPDTATGYSTYELGGSKDLGKPAQQALEEAKFAYQEAHDKWSADRTRENSIAATEAMDTYNRAKYHWENSDEYQAGNRTPQIVPAIASIRNPKIVEKTKDMSFEKMDKIIRKARKDGHDAVIFKDSLDNPNRGSDGTATHYAIFNPDNVVSMADLSRRELQQANAARLQVINDAISQDAAKPGYKYEQQVVKVNSPGQVSNGVDLTGLTKVKELTELQPKQAQAEGMKLNEGTTGQEAALEAATVVRPPDGDEEKLLEAADKAVAKANILEQIMKLAAGCE